MPRASSIEAGVERFRHAVTERHLGVEGLHIHTRNGAPIAVRWVSDDRREVYSVSKTFTSVAIGMARAEGLLDLEASVLTFLPEFAAIAAPGIDAVTIHQLLTMTSGIGYRWQGEDNDHPGDPAADILSTPLDAEPGEQFAYRGGNSYLLSRIISAVSGQDMRDYLMPRLFVPLKIGNPQWLRCPLGFSMGAVGLQLRTEEVSRLGITLLNRGQHGGRQVVPGDYVDLMHDEAISSNLEGVQGAYGLHCWHCDRDDAWRMDGLYGQFSIIFPRQQACITLTSHYEQATTDILDAVWDELVPTL
ncbi:CubicO group peptidase (beta-lactamase class C family) [Friedmanniella endophytica]|uniref:CubicO group peptidase (Beta-lactamase class C family) n=1 Tax=Microlunatus kandeliicorticis TaxID=1759536 RepID=A0A7W3IRT1_9ACTN|nr:serine hydrolase [Microlunatus kandeliicorticis]MBA8794042.1 CubicO group peptidase (beta-lactamase class C family) [Microlunatus kandeliicorticis]